MDREARRRELRKHGGSKHDQKSHGNRYGNTARELRDRIASGGGFSVKTRTGEDPPPFGYMVAFEPSEQVIKLENLTEREIARYRRKHQTALNNPENYFGAWLDGDDVYLDVSRRFTDMPQAMEFGLLNNQLEGYNLSTGESFGIRRIDRNPRPAHLTKRGAGWIYVPLDGLNDRECVEAIRDAARG